MNKTNWGKIIKTGFQILGMTAPALIVWYINRPKPKTSPKIRLIRNQGKIAKTKLKHETENARTKLRQETENARLKLRQKWEMEHLEIENQTILEEMAYETEKLRWESGLAENTKPEMPSIPGGQNNSDLLSGLKQQGTNFFQSQVDKVKQTAEDKVNQFSQAANEKIDEITKTKPKKEE